MFTLNAFFTFTIYMYFTSDEFEGGGGWHVWLSSSL